MLVIYSYKVLTVDHVYRYLLLKGLNLALWVESVTTPREEVSLLSRSSRLSVTWLVCLIRSVFPGRQKKKYERITFLAKWYMKAYGVGARGRGAKPPRINKYLLSTPPPGRDLSNTISCLTLKIRNRSRDPVAPALLLLITLCRVSSAGGASE